MQLVFFLLKLSVAAMKIETSCLWLLRSFEVPLDCDILSTPDVEEGISFGFCVEVFRAGPESLLGDGGGIGYPSGADGEVFMTLK